MILTLYHGSEYVIEHPELKKGKPHNDFGRGFYCTENMELAKEWACADRRNGFANEYTIDIDGLSVLDLNDPEYNVLNWLAVLADNRTYWQKGSISEEAKAYIKEHFLLDISQYDIIRGYRADDSYFTFAQDFAAGSISINKLNEALHLGKLGDQIVLKSEKAFSRISYVGSIAANADIYYPKKAERDLQARRRYRESVKYQSSKDELYILDIMREGIENGDPRLQ
ncbi:MAG: DUF3990 domain-containing protein [Eubacterium sp.]|nr:DUF3990 domain-containing protein [Eubacterium sp.]